MSQNIQSLVSEFADRLEELIRADVESRVQQILQGAFGRSGKGRGKGNGRGAARSSIKRGKVSPGRRLQGQYIGALRSLKGRERNEVKAIFKKDGVEAALKLANKLRNQK